MSHLPIYETMVNAIMAGMDLHVHDARTGRLSRWAALSEWERDAVMRDIDKTPDNYTALVTPTFGDGPLDDEDPDRYGV